MLRVKSICKEQGISLKELAKRMKISPEAITRMLSEKGNPTLSTLGNVAKALDVDVYELFDHFTSAMIVHGYLEINNKIYRIQNFKELQALYFELANKNESTDSVQNNLLDEIDTVTTVSKALYKD